MPQHNVIIVLVLSLGFVSACEPSKYMDTVDQGSSAGADAQGPNAPRLFGPDGFSAALKSIPSSSTCPTKEEQWQVQASGAGLNTLAFVAQTTNMATYCSIKIDVPITNKVDFTKYPIGLIYLDTNYINSNGSMELQVDINGMSTVVYLGAKTNSATNRSFAGRFDTTGIQNDKVSLTVGIDFPTMSTGIFSGDRWVLSNVSAYAAQ